MIQLYVSSPCYFILTDKKGYDWPLSKAPSLGIHFNTEYIIIQPYYIYLGSCFLGNFAMNSIKLLTEKQTPANVHVFDGKYIFPFIFIWKIVFAEYFLKCF